MPPAQNHRDRARPPAEPLEPPKFPDILDAEILSEPSTVPSGPAPAAKPPPAEPQTSQQLTELTELQTQLKHEQRRDRRRLLAHLQDTERRLLGHLFSLYGQTDRLERKLDRLLFERHAQRSQRSTLALLALLALGIAYITVIHPNWRSRPPVPSQPAPTAPNAVPEAVAPVVLPPPQLSAFFGLPELAQTPNRQQRARGRSTSYRITDVYRVRPVHPSTGQRSRPECLNKSLTEIDAQKIAGCVAHRGVDVGTPIGTPLAAIAQPGSSARIECIRQPPWGTYARIESPSLPGWTFIAHHLQTCHPGTYPAGSSFGTTGTAGTGPHLHFGTKYQGKWLAPPLGFVEWILGGEKPSRS